MGLQQMVMANSLPSAAPVLNDVAASAQAGLSGQQLSSTMPGTGMIQQQAFATMAGLPTTPSAGLVPQMASLGQQMPMMQGMGGMPGAAAMPGFAGMSFGAANPQLMGNGQQMATGVR